MQAADRNPPVRQTRRPRPRALGAAHGRRRNPHDGAVKPALQAARNAPGGKLYRYAGSHYDWRQGGRNHDEALDIEVDNLHRHAKN
ncbi:MAG TPA: hypothetical protein VIV12_21805 [Streptosporangiaceae bacterium]